MIYSIVCRLTILVFHKLAFANISNIQLLQLKINILLMVLFITRFILTADVMKQYKVSACKSITWPPALGYISVRGIGVSYKFIVRLYFEIRVN